MGRRDQTQTIGPVISGAKCICPLSYMTSPASSLYYITSNATQSAGLIPNAVLSPQRENWDQICRHLLQPTVNAHSSVPAQNQVLEEVILTPVKF